MNYQKVTFIFGILHHVWQTSTLGRDRVVELSNGGRAYVIMIMRCNQDGYGGCGGDQGVNGQTNEWYI